jgi:hypothetical protein
VALSEAQQFLEAVRALLPADIVAAASTREINPDVAEEEHS